MRNSYNDNRCLVPYFVRHYLRVHIEPPRNQHIYNVSCRLSLCFFLHRAAYLHSSLRCVTLCPYDFVHPFIYHFTTIRISVPKISRSTGIPSAPSSLSLVSFLFYITASIFFFLSTGIFGFSCRRVWTPPYLPYRSRHSDFFFCFIFFSGDFLFICRTKS